MERITVVGAGLAGALVSLYLVKRGFGIDIFESREDPRLCPADPGLSINLALSCRGITGLEGVGLMEKVRSMMVPMVARAIHELDGTVHFQPFGRHPGEHINAIVRQDLNVVLLEALEACPNVRLHFKTRLKSIDFERKTATFADSGGQLMHHAYTRLIGADGAASRLRDVLAEAGIVDAVREFFPHSYKELTIGEAHGNQMARHHLHLWPRHTSLLLGNPNRDDSITGTLFLPDSGAHSFETLTTPEALLAFFRRAFPDALAVMPNLVEEFFAHPTGRMSTIRCTPWHYRDDILLIGDAAHGIIPFFGQGMNCAFEDCRILNQLLEHHHNDWSSVMPAFYQTRKPDTEAVARMSLDNFNEIHRDISDKGFGLKKRIELELMHRYPDIYVSKHIQVMFTNTPYAKALACGEVQKSFLETLCHDIEDLDEIKWQHVEQKLPEYVNKLTEKGL
ncbi:FAD-dependent monooxygenase [Legionella geestiana]|uniref:FAD-dependent oxidoreductase n=1 Tax=Legionella geestiana TaxID=45065 RepID=UPI001091D0E2|nr:NAD(P)/FAD-dependent oxidoreductase [Legionella geestiana]QDQ40880.1 FAD-dependent monooxygenase [Legionella geestiana]